MGILSALFLIVWGFRPVVLLSIFAFLCAPTWWHHKNVDYPDLYHVNMGSYTLIVGVLKYFLIFGGFFRLDSDPLGLLYCGAFVHFCFSLCSHVMVWPECWLSTPVSCDHGILHLDCWSLKIFSHFGGFCPPWSWSFGAFCPVVLLSILAFLCASMWWHDENVDCPDLFHVIIWSYRLIVSVLKHFLIFGCFVRLDSDPLGLSSYGAFVHFCFSLCGHVMAWRECWLYTPVSCDHGIVHLDCWSYKIDSHFSGFFVRLVSDRLGLSSCGAFVHFCFSLCGHVMTSQECWLSRPVSCDHGIVHLDCWSLKIFSHFGGFCPPWSWSFGAFVHFGFSLCLNVMAWRECWLLTPVLCDHGIVHLNCWSLKIFSHFGGFVRLDSDRLGLSSCGAFVHFCFSLCAHVMAWWECWLSTPVSCDHGIVHLNCWSLKIFSHFWGFCPPWFWSFGAFVLWCFVHFCFSLCSHVMAWQECWLYTPVLCDHVIIHLDCWSLKIFSHFWGFYLPWFWSFGAFVLWCFCPFLLLSVRTRDGMMRMLIVQTCVMWSWDRTPWLLESWNIFSFLGVLSALILILWGFRPVVLLSIFAFLCAATWWHYENVCCPHLYHVIMGLYTLIVGVLKYFLIWGRFVRLDPDPLGLLSCGAFVHFGFSLCLYVMAWRECWLSRPVSCDHGILHLDCWSLKNCLIFGGFVRLDSDPFVLSSCGAFVHFCFSLCGHVMAWRECLLSTPVSCDHGIVHLDCLSLKIYSHFWEFCPPCFWSFGAFVLWCFCPFLLFSVRPRDDITRMLIIQTCIMWTWDRTPWLLES